MQYLMLVYTDDALMDALPDGQFDTLMRGCLEHADELRACGSLTHSQQLEHPRTARSIRVRDGRMSVVDGPFSETKELVAGFWLWQVRSREEAIEWLKRAPFDGGTEIELRPVFEAADFAEFDPQLRADEERMRAQSGYAER